MSNYQVIFSKVWILLCCVLRICNAVATGKFPPVSDILDILSAGKHTTGVIVLYTHSPLAADR